MESNKYYTPNIGEFHIGFEYEVKDPFKKDWDNEFSCKKDFLELTIPCDNTKYSVVDFGWKKKTFGDYNEIKYKNDYEVPFDELQYVEKNGILEPILFNYRVKYLDREDIESLGFSDKDLNIPTKFSFYKKVKNDKIYEIKTYWDMEKNERENLIRIFKGNLHNYPYKEIFRGNIKNKSELKTLLKQLIINDTE
jgi:hypothetical protein